MSILNYDGLKVHLGHKLECVQYGNGENIAIECLDCNEVLLDYDRNESEATNIIREDIEAVIEGCCLGISLTEEQMQEIILMVEQYDYTCYDRFVLESIQKVVGLLDQ